MSRADLALDDPTDLLAPPPFVVPAPATSAEVLPDPSLIRVASREHLHDLLHLLNDHGVCADLPLLAGFGSWVASLSGPYAERLVFMHADGDTGLPCRECGDLTADGSNQHQPRFPLVAVWPVSPSVLAPIHEDLRDAGRVG